MLPCSGTPSQDAQHGDFEWDLLAPDAAQRRSRLREHLANLSMLSSLGDPTAIFSDHSFPTDVHNLREHITRPNRISCWHRVVVPLFGHVASSDDYGKPVYRVEQGIFDNCWLVSSMATLSTQHPEHLRSIIDDEFFDIGAVFVRCFKDGKWRECVIDNFLPRGLAGQELSARSLYLCASGKHQHVSWAPLLEKAWAKMHASYDALGAGSAADALSDLTGGLAYTIGLRDALSTLEVANGTLRKQLHTLLHRGTGLAVCSSVDMDAPTNPPLALGSTCTSEVTYVATSLADDVVKNHSYAVLAYNEDADELTLLNPWGSAMPGLCNGAFQITWGEFLATFNTLHMCELVASPPPSDFAQPFEPALRGMLQLCGSWNAENGTAGGNHDLQTFGKNPHYRLRLRCRACVSILLKQFEGRSNTQANQYVPLGIWVAPLTAQGEPRHDAMCCSLYISARQQVLTVNLDEGEHIIVPCSWSPVHEASFSLAVCARVSQACHVLLESVIEEFQVLRL